MVCYGCVSTCLCYTYWVVDMYSIVSGFVCLLAVVVWYCIIVVVCGLDGDSGVSLFACLFGLLCCVSVD